MVALKAQEADRVIAAPPASVSLWLVYGPDSGLVAERAARLAAAYADPADPFSLIRLDAAALASDPSRLADEAYAISMFGGRRAIMVRDAGSRASLAEVFAPLLRNPPPETAVIVEAGDLKKTSPIRVLFERDRTAYAVPCYVDDAAAIGRLVDEEMKAHGLSITPAARAMLVSHLGGDRLLSRSEVSKLCLYALDAGKVDVDDVEEMVADSAGVAVDEIADATATGDLAGLQAALVRAAREGLDPSWIATACMRHFHMLDLGRAAMGGGASAEQAVEGMRPPVFFKRKGKVAKALQAWSPAALDRAILRLASTARDARLDSALGRDLLSDTLFTLARHAGRR